MTVEEVNRFLDSIEGYPPETRFQTSRREVDKKSGRISIYYLSWRNGEWVDTTRERQKELRSLIRNEE